MADRTVEDILRDWRAAEADLPQDGSSPDLELVERINFLRVEYAAEVDARRDSAEDLGRAPGEDPSLGDLRASA